MRPPVFPVLYGERLVFCPCAVAYKNTDLTVGDDGGEPYSKDGFLESLL